MKLQANEQDITIEQASYVAIDFTESGEDFSGLNLFFVLSRSESLPEPEVIKDQGVLTIAGETVTAVLSTDDTDFKGPRWYEVWVEWKANQWSKEFKGRLIATKSTNYK